VSLFYGKRSTLRSLVDYRFLENKAKWCGVADMQTVLSGKQGCLGRMYKKKNQDITLTMC